MSEYQYLAFRAVDHPLTDRALEFSRQQSTRAHITRWSFENEYHFGDFHGDADGMLRRGFDVHLHYANFGIRSVAIRLPNGLPCKKSVWSMYTGINALFWNKDKSGKGGILKLQPYFDPGEIDEIISPEEYVDSLVTIRERLISGDLRALYLFWLCATIDSEFDLSELSEPPVPDGLDAADESSKTLLEFFGHDPFIIQAAAAGAPSAPPANAHEQQILKRIDNLDEASAKKLLREFIMNDTATVKSRFLAEIQSHEKWPTVDLGRTLGDLFDRAQILREECNAKLHRQREAVEKRAAEKKELERQKRMKTMIDDPRQWLGKATKFVEGRGVANYAAAAEILADLREAVGGADGELIAHEHATMLTKKNPRLNRLKSELRKRNLLD